MRCINTEFPEIPVLYLFPGWFLESTQLIGVLEPPVRALLFEVKVGPLLWDPRLQFDHDVVHNPTLSNQNKN